MGEMEFARKGLVKAVDAALQAQILGMKKIIRDESLRRALAHLAPNQPKLCSDKERAARRAQLARSTAWMDTALSESTREASPALRSMAPFSNWSTSAPARNRCFSRCPTSSGCAIRCCCS